MISPPNTPVDFTHLYLPSMEFDRCEVEGKWAFVQLGSAYAAVYCSNGMRMQDFGSNKDRECIAEGRRCIWLVRAAQADEFAAFEDFKTAMRGAALDADARAAATALWTPSTANCAASGARRCM